MIGVDTNILLNILRKDDPPIQKHGSLRFLKFIQQEQTTIALSAICITELFRKPFRDDSVEEKQKLDEFLHVINARIIDITNDAAIEAAKLIEQQHMKFADALIAASLIFAGVKIFITRNKEDYKKTNLEVLTPEDFIKKSEE